MGNFDDMKLAVQALSGGKNTVVLDDLGYPSIMVIMRKALLLWLLMLRAKHREQQQEADL